MAGGAVTGVRSRSFNLLNWHDAEWGEGESLGLRNRSAAADPQCFTVLHQVLSAKSWAASRCFPLFASSGSVASCIREMSRNRKWGIEYLLCVICESLRILEVPNVGCSDWVSVFPQSLQKNTEIVRLSREQNGFSWWLQDPECTALFDC